MVQELYVAYFGRPADYQGLQNFELALAAANAPTTISGLETAYAGNAIVKNLVDSFGSSTESIALYGSGSTESFVNAIFENLFNRAPAVSGSSFWVNAIESGLVSRGDAALAISAGALTNTTAQGLVDAQTVNNKLTIAGDFTNAISTSTTDIAAYSGATAAAAARTLIAGVNNLTQAGSTDNASVTFTVGSAADGKVDSITLGNNVGASGGEGSTQTVILGFGAGSVITTSGNTSGAGANIISTGSATVHITAGNGTNVISATEATSGTISVGSGANSITVGPSPNSYIFLAAHAASVADSITLGVSGTSLAGIEDIAGLNNVGADTITFADAASVAAGGIQQITATEVGAAGGDATLLASWIAAATGAAGSGVTTVAHGINWFVFQGFTYLVETAAVDTGALTSHDTVVELSGTGYTFAKSIAVAGTLHLLG